MVVLRVPRSSRGKRDAFIDRGCIAFTASVLPVAVDEIQDSAHYYILLDRIWFFHGCHDGGLCYIQGVKGVPEATGDTGGAGRLELHGDHFPAFHKKEIDLASCRCPVEISLPIRQPGEEHLDAKALP